MFVASDKAQQWLVQRGVEMLHEKLQTRVEIDSVGVNFFNGSVGVYGVRLDDRDSVQMLSVDTLTARVNLPELLANKLMIGKVTLHGADMILYKERKDSAANYQFVIDAFKKKKQPKTENDGKKKSKMQVEVGSVELSRVHFKWDVCDQQRKNFGKPKRGAFDANHVDVSLNLDAKISKESNDSVRVKLKHLDAFDHASGLYIAELQTEVGVSKSHFSTSPVLIKTRNMQIDLGEVNGSFKTIPADTVTGTKKSIDLQLSDFPVKANVYLPDIAKPFAPVLSRFTTRLNLEVTCGGNIDRFTFKNIKVTTPDGRLNLTGNGDLCNVTKGKENLALHFNGLKLTARRGIKEQIVRHFQHNTKLKMLRQLAAIGDVRFKGYLNVLYKKEAIGGTLTTMLGVVSTDFVIDGRTKYMYGTMATDGFNVGTMMNITGLQAVKCSARFNFNVAGKPKNKKYKKNGRLPQGEMEAQVSDAQYKKLKLKEINMKVRSDGREAEGIVYVPMKLMGLEVFFNYRQTPDEQNLRYKVKFRKKSKDSRDLQSDLLEMKDKARQKEERKALREQQKAKIKEERMRLKEEHKRLKEERKRLAKTLDS